MDEWQNNYPNGAMFCPLKLVFMVFTLTVETSERNIEAKNRKNGKELI